MSRVHLDSTAGRSPILGRPHAHQMRANEMTEATLATREESRDHHAHDTAHPYVNDVAKSRLGSAILVGG
jgi:hypothetical protein